MGKPITATTDDGYALSFYDSDRIGEEMVQSNFGRCVLIRLAPFAFTAAVDHTGSRGLFFFQRSAQVGLPTRRAPSLVRVRTITKQLRPRKVVVGA